MDRAASSLPVHPHNGILTKEEVRAIVREEVAAIIKETLAASEEANKERWRQIARVLDKFEVLLAGSKDFDNIGLLEKHRLNSEAVEELKREFTDFKNAQTLKDGVFDAKMRAYMRATIFYASLVSGLIQLAALFLKK